MILWPTSIVAEVLCVHSEGDGLLTGADVMFNG
jgi:hypothetical protein